MLPAQDVQSALALPGCRTALGVSATEPAQQLLSTNPNLAAQVATTPACRVPHNALSRLERLEQELAASRQRIAAQQSQLAAENACQDALAADLAHLRAQLTGQPLTPGVPAVAASSAELPTAGSVHYTPGKGFSLQAGGSSLRLWAEAKLLGFSSSRYTFNPGQPLIVSPKDPAASYDLSAQQSMVYAAFRGPKWGSWTPGAFALFWLQDNLLAEGYSFMPVVLYGDIGNGVWRVAAGQNFDVFAPRDPDTLPNGKLAATGNPGAYRPQFRLERSFEAGPGFGGLLQLAASSPVTTALPSDVDLANLPSQEIVEDNGWPNLEARLNLGFGAYAEAVSSTSARAWGNTWPASSRPTTAPPTRRCPPPAAGGSSPCIQPTTCVSTSATASTMPRTPASSACR